MVATLTPRRRQVLELVLQGRTSLEIAEALVVSVRTVESHTRYLRALFGCRSLAALVAKVLGERCAELERRNAEMERYVEMASFAAANLGGAGASAELRLAS